MRQLNLRVYGRDSSTNIHPGRGGNALDRRCIVVPFFSSLREDKHGGQTDAAAFEDPRRFLLSGKEGSATPPIVQKITGEGEGQKSEIGGNFKRNKGTKRGKPHSTECLASIALNQTSLF